MNIKRELDSRVLHHAYNGNSNGSLGQLPVIGNDIRRSLTTALNPVRPGSSVTIEGTPLYFGRPWEHQHEFGINKVLPALRYLLEQQGCSVSHYALLDNFTTGQSGDPQAFVSRMRDRPSRIFYESEFQDEAEKVVSSFRQSGKTLAVNGELLLSVGRYPRLRTMSGRVSCETLDACFQRRKVGEYHLIIHPNDFVHQQEGMRSILRELHDGRLPWYLINIFFKNTAISRAYLTDTTGAERRIL